MPTATALPFGESAQRSDKFGRNSFSSFRGGGFLQNNPPCLFLAGSVIITTGGVTQLVDILARLDR